MNLNKLLGSVGASFVGLLTTYLGTIFNSNLNHVTVTLYFVCAFLAIALVIFIYDDFSMRFNAFSKKLLSNNQEISTKAPQKTIDNENEDKSTLNQLNKNISDE